MITTTLTTEVRKHHDYSPSSLQNLEACPCYRNKESAHVSAIRGTMQHSVTESGVDDHKLDDDEASLAAECLDFCERQRVLMEDERKAAVESLAVGLWGKPVAPGEEAEVLKNAEQKIDPILNITEAYLPVDDCEFDDVAMVTKKNPEGVPFTIYEKRRVKSTTAGYVDRALISWNRKRAVLVDYKFGAWEVEAAENNLQGIAYSLGLFKAYPTLEKITFYFKQPKLNSITQATFRRDQVPALYLRVQTVVARAREARHAVAGAGDFSMARPLVPACNFCALIGVCPKVAEFACTVGKKFDPIGIPSDLTPTGLKSAEDTTVGLRLAQVMAIWADAFKRQINERVMRRAIPIPPGYILQTKKDREIADPVKFKGTTLKYLTREELEPLAEYGFGKVEEAIKDKAPRGTKTSTLETYKQELIDTGAVKFGDPYTFLRVASSKDKTEQGQSNQT